MALVNRIGYIDAARGAAMLMVVFSHVLLFSFGKATSPGFNDLFSLVMLPMLFFISGYLSMRRFNAGFKSVLAYIWKKFLALVIPTIIFHIIFSLVIESGYLVWIDKAKQGFWFTYTLFFYCFVYAVGDYLLSKVVDDKVLVWIGTVFSFLLYGFAKFSLSNACAWNGSVASNLLGYANLQYFIYFYLGLVLCNNREAFFKIIDNSKIMALIASLFLSLFLFLEVVDADVLAPSILSIFKTLSCLFGIVALFAFFRRYDHYFTKGTLIGRVLQTIGIYSFDIYILHLFFIRFDMSVFGFFLVRHNNPIIELFLGMLYALMIIGICLAISNFIRCSDTLAKLLFGKVIPKGEESSK